MEDSMLEKEYQLPYENWQKNKNPKTMGALVQAINPVLESGMRTYAGKAASPTVKSRAKLIAIESMPKYDPTRAKLRTHLMSQLQGLRRVSAQEAQIISIPERVGLDLYHLRMSENELRDRLGRDPSTIELADHTGLSTKRIGYIRKAQPGLPEGSLQPVSESEESVGTGPAVANVDDEPWLDFIYRDLHPTDQIIMEHTLGLHGKPQLSKQRIASKLRLSPGAVSQRAARIQDRINKREELGLKYF